MSECGKRWVNASRALNMRSETIKRFCLFYISGFHLKLITNTSQHIHSSMEKLAEEIVCNIAARLGSDDLFNLRLTCRTLQKNSFHEFATEYFQSKAVHFTSDSLKSLVAISESKALRAYIRNVYVSTKIFTEHIFDERDCGCCIWEPPTVWTYAYRIACTDTRHRRLRKHIAPMPETSPTSSLQDRTTRCCTPSSRTSSSSI